ncbi:hypothetical protein P8825_14560 [Shouchella clausii]|uniref:hypothetical protein n=1 Tax=Shouchella clausii TaxID=79880 RepID=UPI002DB7FCED|nr:hypothetical protein [Shouchella clausii]MEB5480786.1 hypothetical protein [Shouchella clausii]
MPKPNEFTSLNELFANLNKTITGIIQDENGSVVKAGIDALKTSVQENVYDVYDPYLYERTGELKEEWKVEKEDGGIAIMSNRYDGNTYVAQVVETGVGYRYSFLFDGTPRPFTQLAAEELQGTGKLTLALSNELKRRGFRLVLKAVN